MSDDLHEREAALQITGRDLDQFQAEVSASTTRSHNWNRHFIVIVVVGAYAGVLSFTILYLFIKGLWSEIDTFASMAEILKIGVVPIVTLVIGYYFSKHD